jgi:spermidine/putrescine transport system permease protein
MDALFTTLRITLSSSILATVLGTSAAIGINRMKKRHAAIMLGATNIPLLNADIVTGISLMLLFTRFSSLGEFSVVLAHIAFSVPYVIFNVLPKLQSMSDACYEAAMDLGATPWYAFCKVIWPEIFPGVLSGFLMAFTMSLDDFTITYFTKGGGVNTLSTMLYTELRKGIQPELYALSTLLFLFAFVLLFVTNYKGNSKEEATTK